MTKSFPINLKSKATRAFHFDVTFDCANDPAKTTKKDPGHDDFRYVATVDRSVLDALPDTHAADDTCPRSVTAPYVIDPNPDGKIKDKGCGDKKDDGTFGRRRDDGRDRESVAGRAREPAGVAAERPHGAGGGFRPEARRPAANASTITATAIARLAWATCANSSSPVAWRASMASTPTRIGPIRSQGRTVDPLTVRPRAVSSWSCQPLRVIGCPHAEP